MSASPVVVPLHRAALTARAAGWQLDDALDSAPPVLVMERVRDWMADIDVTCLEAREQIDLITELERIKSAAAATQARSTVAFTTDKVAAALDGYRAQAGPIDTDARTIDIDARRRAHEEADVVAACVRSVGSEIALARRESPTRGDRFIGMAKALVHEMPHTMNALERGRVSEWGATEMVRGTAVLSIEDRAAVDAILGPRLESMSPRQIDQATRREAAARDAAAVVRRREQAVKSRRVSIRPAPDGMAYLTLLTGMKEAVAAYASLHRHAQSVAAGTAFHAGSDGESVQELPAGRGLGAIMTDSAIARLTGLPTGVPAPVEVQLVITDRALLGTGDPSRSIDEPARIPGHGPVPAPTARAWLRPDNAGTSGASAANCDLEETVDPRDAEPAVGLARDNAENESSLVWLRRLYTSPDGRDLVAMDSRRRTFTGLLRRMLILRDDVCRIPYCDAPIAQHDHITAHAVGGVTGFTNGEGLCIRCNQVKEVSGWKHTVTSSDSPTGQGPRSRVPSRGRTPTPHTVRVITPSGQIHHSSAPPLLGYGWAPPTRGPDNSCPSA